MKKKSDVLPALRQASKGLLFISESKAPLEPFQWEAGDLSTEVQLSHAGADEGAQVEEMTLAGFFRAVPKEDKPKFDKLAKVLGDHLDQVKVYKVGDEPEKQVFIVGKAADGSWVGLKTTVVET